MFFELFMNTFDAGEESIECPLNRYTLLTVFRRIGWSGINGAIEDSDSFRDTIHSKRQFASPSIAHMRSSTTCNRAGGSFRPASPRNLSMSCASVIGTWVPSATR